MPKPPIALTSAPPPEHAEFQALIDELLRLRGELVAVAVDSLDILEHVHPSHRESAENLLQYIALRGRDLRSLQMRLAKAGLSSLGRAEAHVLSAVDAVLAMLHRAVGRALEPNERALLGVDLESGPRLLGEHTEAILGPVPSGRGVAIMVTVPGEAADDYTVIQQLVEHGVDCLRINCAHDDQAAWSRMLEHLRRAEQATGRKCRVLMDLAGPKLRTGPLEPGPAVVKIRPARDAFGHVSRPARVWLSSQDAPREPPTPADAAIQFPDAFVKALAVGDRLAFTDARRSKRAIDVVAQGADGCWAESMRTCYLTTDARVRAVRGKADIVAEARIAAIPPTANRHPPRDR